MVVGWRLHQMVLEVFREYGYDTMVLPVVDLHWDLWLASDGKDWTLDDIMYPDQPHVQEPDDNDATALYQAGCTDDCIEVCRCRVHQISRLHEWGHRHRKVSGTPEGLCRLVTIPVKW